MHRLLPFVLILAACNGMPPTDTPPTQAAPTKVPHLVVLATGMDLGVLLGAGSCTFNEVAGGEVCFREFGDQFLYETEDCTGPRYIPDRRRLSSRLVDARDGTVWQPMLPTTREILVRASGDGRECSRMVPPDSRVSFMPLARTAAALQAFPPEALVVELR